MNKAIKKEQKTLKDLLKELENLVDRHQSVMKYITEQEFRNLIRKYINDT